MNAALMSELVVCTFLGSPPWAARSAANRSTVAASRPSVAKGGHPGGVEIGEQADVVLPRRAEVSSIPTRRTDEKSSPARAVRT
nr:hypothetical protein [Saccharopolyspora sp. ASAGF58]